MRRRHTRGRLVRSLLTIRSCLYVGLHKFQYQDPLWYRFLKDSHRLEIVTEQLPKASMKDLRLKSLLNLRKCDIFEVRL